MPKKLVVAVTLICSLVVSTSGCAADFEAPPDHIEASDLLKMPDIDDADGLRINGELVADEKLLEKARADTVNLYSGTGKEAEDLTVARFTEETGIKVNLTRLPTNKLFERALSEHGAGKLNAGVIRMTDVRLARKFSEKDIFQDYRPPAYEKLKEQGRWPSDSFVDCYYYLTTMAYNSAVITEGPPTTWQDLENPKYEDKVGIDAITTGGTLNAQVHFQIENFGLDHLRGIEQNNPRIFDSTATQVAALARGEISVAPVSLHNAFATELSGAPIKLVIPDEGVSASAGVMGLTEKGIESPASKVFMNWTMSESGQRFAGAQGFAPTRTDIDPVKTGDYELPSADSDRFHLFDEDDFAQYAKPEEEEWKDIFNFLG